MNLRPTPGFGARLLSVVMLAAAVTLLYRAFWTGSILPGFAGVGLLWCAIRETACEAYTHMKRREIE